MRLGGWLLGGCLVLLSHAGLWADTVVLTNGARLEGVVEQETTTEITLRTAEGRLRLNRGKVRAIERAAAGTAPTAPTKSLGVDTPKAFDGIWTELTALDKLQKSAEEALEKLTALERAQAETLLRVKPLNEALNNKTARLTVLESQIAQYKGRAGQEDKLAAAQAEFRKLQAEGNVERDALVRLRQQFEARQKEAQAIATPRTEYPRRLEAFVRDHAERRARYLAEGTDQAAAFFARVDERLGKHVRLPAEVREIPLGRVGDDLTMRLVVDTKTLQAQVQTRLSHLVLTPSAARRLGLKPTGQRVDVQLSEGGTLSCEALPAVDAQAGPINLPSLPAVLAPEPLGDFDALFGLGLIADSLFRVDLDKPAVKVLALPPSKHTAAKP
jgi:Aspartyl protease